MVSRYLSFQKPGIDDVMLKLVINYHMKGWPKDECIKDSNLKAFYKMRNNLDVVEDLLFVNDRIVVPVKLQHEMLNLLHEGHFGVNRTRDRAREIFYWPGMMTVDIEKMISACRVCERYRCANEKEPLILHEIAELPFQKVASDIFEFHCKSYVVVVDYLTKWMEVIELKHKTSEDIVDALKQVFAVFGVPDIVVSDNMPYNSSRCKEFAKQWDFQFQTSSPRYPRSNGLAERAVQTVKNMLKKSNDLHAALLEYRNTQITGLKRSPSQLLFKYPIKTKLPLVITNQQKCDTEYKCRLEKKREAYKKAYDKNAKEKDEFKKGEGVVYQFNKKWYPAVIEEKFDAPRSYLIRNEEDNMLRRNSFHLRKSKHLPIIEPTIKIELDETVINNSNDRNRLRMSSLNGDGTINEKSNENTETRQTRGARPIRLPNKFKDHILY